MPEDELYVGLALLGQDSLVRYLLGQIELAFTLLGLAGGIQTLERRQTLLGDARKSLKTVRHFEGKITSQDHWKHIHDRADQLEMALRAPNSEH